LKRESDPGKFEKSTMEFIKNLQCPLTKNGLDLINKNDFAQYKIQDDFYHYGNLTKGLLDKSHQYFYPVFDDIIVLHEQYALYIGEGTDIRKGLSFDKKRVFDYYNEIDYKIKDSLKIYEDSPKWVDFREVSSKYVRNSFVKATRFYPSEGKYLLDIASGPIGLPEYMELSNGYEYRICVDISINALLQAKVNIQRAGKKGLFICGDITNIPIQDYSCDVVLSQHTLYHIPKSDQMAAVNEMYRVAKENSKIVIVYSWFYRSWFMNISLNFIQIYRVLRHFIGKLYVRIIKSKPRLYFYPHSLRWFKKTFTFSSDIEIFCWRSVNKNFLNIYIHRWLFGRQILEILGKIEDKHSSFMGRFGEYPLIVITKRMEYLKKTVD
jgi:ubiquinone/menaquinone biosynthesis C-methylase UbiE